MRDEPPKTGKLPFEYEATEDDGKVTAYGGLPLVADTMRVLGVDRSVRRHVRIGKRQRTHDAATLVEAFVLLMAVGGDCIDDFEMLREDKALCRLLDRPMADAVSKDRAQVPVRAPRRWSDRVRSRGTP